MALGISTHSFALWPLAGRHFELVRDAGFTGVEVWAMAPHVEIEIAGAVVYWMDAARRAGLEILSVHLPFYRRYGAPDFRYLNLGDTDRDAAKEASNLAQRCLAQAGHCGAKIAVLHGIGGCAGDEVEKIRLFIEDLEPIVEMAARVGVVIALENIMTPLSTAIDLARIVDHFASPHLKACLDVGHANVNEHVFGAVTRLGERIASVHVHDNHGESDEHLLPGDGTIDWDTTVDALRRYGDPNLILETRWPMAGDEIDEGIYRTHLAAARERMRDVFGV